MIDNNNLFLIYINTIGEAYLGDRYYEFLFSDSIEKNFNENWYDLPNKFSNNKTELMPEYETINYIGSFKSKDIRLELLQFLDAFPIIYATKNIISLGWSSVNDEKEFNNMVKFDFGESYESVKSKLYSLDINLELKENKYV
jgi:hypothetical protein